jgi:hypothetical protein
MKHITYFSFQKKIQNFGAIYLSLVQITEIRVLVQKFGMELSTMMWV